jgi:hypothetical protein
MSPQEAGEVLSAAGLGVSWRLQHTLPDGTMVADIVGAVPDGTVVDLMVADGQAFIFVAPEGDPAAKRPDHPSC